MNQDDSSSGSTLMYRQEISTSDELLGINYEFDFAVIYLEDGSFYLEFPTTVTVVSTEPPNMAIGDVEEVKAIILGHVIEELKKAPHYTETIFNLRYIPNPKIDPDYDHDINPFDDF